MKKLLAGLCALVLVGSALVLARADGNGSNEGEKGEAQCPGPFTLSVAYADNDSPDGHPGSFVPNPWLGNGCGPLTSCQFLGTVEGNGSWDAGAILIVNTSMTSSLTVDSVTVDIGNDLGIDPWTVAPLSLPATISPGGSLILTETSNNPTHTPDNFDTSDFPPGGSELPPVAGGSCTADNDIPQIHVTVNALGSPIQVVKNFADTGQVLNTGGFDIGLCPPGKNEGHQWALLTEEKNNCCQDKDENGDDNGQNGGSQDKGNTN